VRWSTLSLLYERECVHCVESCTLTPIPHWPLPSVRTLTRDGRWSTYDESVLKLSKVSFRGKRARTRHPLKLPSPTKLARLGCFPPASQAGRLAGPVFYTISFLWIRLKTFAWSAFSSTLPRPMKNIIYRQLLLFCILLGVHAPGLLCPPVQWSVGWCACCYLYIL